jgi:hypothetical protein
MRQSPAVVSLLTHTNTPISVSTSDTLALTFGLVSTFLAIICIIVTRKNYGPGSTYLKPSKL